MKTEIFLSEKAAIEVMKLIQGYLFKGGARFNRQLLELALEALGEADRIVIGEEN